MASVPGWSVRPADTWRLRSVLEGALEHDLERGQLTGLVKNCSAPVLDRLHGEVDRAVAGEDDTGNAASSDFRCRMSDRPSPSSSEKSSTATSGLMALNDSSAALALPASWTS